MIHKQSRVKYVDAGDEQTNSTDSSVLSPSEYSYRANKIYPELNNLFSSLSGGSAKPDIDDTVYATARYVQNRKEDIETFIKEFYLDYLISRSNSNTVLVIPTKTTLKKLRSFYILLIFPKNQKIRLESILIILLIFSMMISKHFSKSMTSKSLIIESSSLPQ